MNYNLASLANDPSILEAYLSGKLSPAESQQIKQLLAMKFILQKMFPELSAKYYDTPLEDVPIAEIKEREMEGVLEKLQAFQATHQLEKSKLALTEGLEEHLSPNLTEDESAGQAPTSIDLALVQNPMGNDSPPLHGLPKKKARFKRNAQLANQVAALNEARDTMVSWKNRTKP